MHSSQTFQRAADAPALPQKPFWFVLHFLKFYHWGLLLMMFFEMGQAACQILIPYSIKPLIDTITQYQGSSSGIYEALTQPFLLFIALNIGVLIFSRLSGTFLVLIGPSLRRRVRHNVYRYLQHHSQRYFMSNFSGSLANRISEVAMSVNHSIWTILFDFWPVMITFSVSMFLVAQVHSGLALFLASWIVLYITCSYFLAIRCQQYSKDFAAARSVVTGKVVDAVTNIQNSKLFARLKFEQNHLDRYLDYEVEKARTTLWFMEKMKWFQFVAALILKVVMIFYALRVWINGEITVGAFAMITSMALLIINDARNLSRRILEFFEYLGNINDGVNIIVKPHEVVDQEDSGVLRIQQGKLEFKDVNFIYSNGTTVFESLDVTIQAGEKVGLVGFSGSGKTTFCNLILRLYDIQKGQILIDGQDIKNVTQDSLRTQISMIPQEPMLFHRSLRENIRYGNLDASDEEVIEASKKAHAHDFIMNQKEGYEALVGERGIRLSGGQRQRIAIARAILKNSPIIIMDEATSSLDSVTERYIQSGLDVLMKDKTVIVIAHRLSTVAHLDRILVFHHGKIIEQGSHLELLKMKGHYSRMWGMQAGGFLPEEDEHHLPREEITRNY